MGAHTGPTKSWTTAHRGALIHRPRFSGTHTGPTKSRTLVIVLLALLMTSVRAVPVKPCDVCGDDVNKYCLPNGVSAPVPKHQKRALCIKHRKEYKLAEYAVYGGRPL